MGWDVGVCVWGGRGRRKGCWEVLVGRERRRGPGGRRKEKGGEGRVCGGGGEGLGGGKGGREVELVVVEVVRTCA